MRSIAALLTCFNRKERTISCLKHLLIAVEFCTDVIDITIHLTDDGSTDETSKLVAELFPDVIILKGNGSLYWAGGMRNSWQEAIRKEYDGYLLLNDDTEVDSDLIVKILKTDEYCQNKYSQKGIYIGSTCDKSTGKTTYGGAVIINKVLFTSQRLVPNNSVLECELGNANIMFVANEVVEKIGILSKSYTHGLADSDYTLRAKKQKIPVLVMENHCGTCSNNPDKYSKFINLTFTKRIKFLYSPIGLAFNDQLKFMMKFFPYRLPFVFLSGWLKVILPHFYIRMNKLR